MWFLLLAGVLCGVLTCATIKHIEKTDTSYGVLKVSTSLMLTFYAVLGVLMVFGSMKVTALPLCMVTVLLWMLLVTSYEDSRCGQFHLIIVCAAAAFHVIVFVVMVFEGTNPVLFGSDLAYLLGMVLVLIGVSFLGLAMGDCAIYFVCMLHFYLVCGNVVGLSLVMISASNVLALLCNAKRFLTKEGRKNRFPFTKYICMGYFVSCMVHFLEQWAL